MKKICPLLLVLIFCLCCFTACERDDVHKNQDSSIENHICSDEDTAANNDSSSNVESENNSSKIESSSSTKPVETSSKEEVSSAKTSSKKPSSNNTPTTKPISHKTVVIGKKTATCTKDGYSGDTYCSKCGLKLASGTDIPALGHTVVLKNQKTATKTKEGYTGDKVCKKCSITIEKGQKIPKIQQTGKVVYKTVDGKFTYTVDEGVDIKAYTMALRTKKVSSNHRAIELEILRLCNKERAKEGLKPLTWYEDAYYFTTIRNEEIYRSWSHERPNGSAWHTVYTDVGVILGTAGENLGRFEGWPIEEVAEIAVEAWMNSSGHRANILSSSFTKIAIRVEYGADNFTVCTTQHFYG